MTRVILSFLAGTACALVLTIPLTAAPATAAKAQQTTAIRTIWPPETLSGKITLVDPDRKLVVVQTADGVPYDIDITAKTLIKSGDQSVDLKDLARDMNQAVSVTFVPERRGDVARTIRIQG
jgi:hypothetical protein